MAVAQGIEERGYQVDIIDGDRDVNTRLTIYGYLTVGSSPVSTFGGKIPESVARFLAGAGTVSGKRCFAYIVKEGMRTSKSLTMLMKAMEREGMYLKYSEILRSPEEAKAIAKRLHIE